MKLSIYTTLYLVNQNDFDFGGALLNFSRFADEVIVSTCPAGCVDDSLDSIKNFIQINKLDNVKIVVNKDVNFNNPLFDGILKDTALKHCTNDIVIGIDSDERLPLKHKYSWIECAEFLLERADVDAIGIPTVDLCKDIYNFKSIGIKPYIHKKQRMNRGVVNYAKKDNGHIDISRSDSTELIDDNGNLARIMWGPRQLEQIKSSGYPYVLHLGWINAEYREKINKWWKPVWESRAGNEVNDVIINKQELESIEVFPHNLELWD